MESSITHLSSSSEGKAPLKFTFQSQIHCPSFIVGDFEGIKDYTVEVVTIQPKFLRI